MKITPSKSQPNTGGVRMEFVWLNDSRTSNKKIAPPRSPRLPAPRKVTRICGNLATSRWLKVRTLTEGCRQIEYSSGEHWVICNRVREAAIWAASLHTLMLSLPRRRPRHGDSSQRGDE